MRILIVCLASALTVGLAGCANTRSQLQPVTYVAAPPPGAKRCMVWGEDMYGRRFCDRYYYGR